MDFFSNWAALIFFIGHLGWTNTVFLSKHSVSIGNMPCVFCQQPLLHAHHILEIIPQAIQDTPD